MKQDLKKIFVLIVGLLIFGSAFPMNNNNNANNASSSLDSQEVKCFEGMYEALIWALSVQRIRDVRDKEEFCKFVIQVNRCLNLFLQGSYIQKMPGAMKLNLARTLMQYWNIVLHYVDTVLKNDNPCPDFLSTELESVCDVLINALSEWTNRVGIQNVYDHENQIWMVFQILFFRDFSCMLDDCTLPKKRDVIVSLGSIAKHCRRLLIFGSKLTQENKQAYNQAIIKKISECGLEIKKNLHDKSKREKLVAFFEDELFQVHYFFFPNHESIR